MQKCRVHLLHKSLRSLPCQGSNLTEIRATPLDTGSSTTCCVRTDLIEDVTVHGQVVKAWAGMHQAHLLLLQHWKCAVQELRVRNLQHTGLPGQQLSLQY